MIVVDVLYASQDDLHFNMSYYLDTHIPLVRKLMGPALKGASVEQGSSGASPGSKPAFAVLTRLLFESVAAFQQAFGPHAAAVTADVANFTNVQPTIQLSDLKLE